VSKRWPGAVRATGARTAASSATQNANLLLAALPRADYQRLAPFLQPCSLKAREVIQQKAEPVRNVYFPGGGVCSLVTPLSDGSMVEMAMVGREGMVGMSATLNGRVAQETALVQIATDTCHRIAIDEFLREMDRRGPLFELVSRYTQALLGLVMQSVACNAVHPVEQRLSRWLLMAHDRTGADEFPLTQELVATMLGTSRPTVSIVAGTLRKAGLIEYRHGRMTILNRRSLEAASCECYRVVTSAYGALLIDPTPVAFR
jgi:CRP-like cAMP-binding protein